MEAGFDMESNLMVEGRGRLVSQQQNSTAIPV
jgi:hypothetical protein